MAILWQYARNRLATGGVIFLRILELLADLVEKVFHAIVAFFTVGIILALTFGIAAAIVVGVGSLFGIPWWGALIILLLIWPK